MNSNGILNIDGVNWSALKFSNTDLTGLSEDEKKARREAEDYTFKTYHEKLKGWIESHGGRAWNTIGDCTIACGFPTIDEAVAAAQAIQRQLTDFDMIENKIDSPLFVRIGVSCGSLPEVPLKDRGEHSTPELNEAGHLQKDCPPGRIRISRKAFDALRFGQHNFRPGLTVDIKSKSAGSLVWVDRMLSAQEQKFIALLPPHQKRCYPPIILSASDLVRQPYKGDFSKVTQILQKAFFIIGETRKQDSIEGPLSHPASTSDAVGGFEVLAALQSSPDVRAGVDEWADSVDLATQTHVVIVGSPSVNLFAYALNTVSPVGFTKSENSLLRIRVNDKGSMKLFPESVEHSEFDRHLGLVLLTKNPINPQYDLIWIAGISGMATQAAARFVRDLVINPLRTLNAINENKPNIAVIVPAWEGGYKLEQYQSKWRISDYEVIWVGRQ